MHSMQHMWRPDSLGVISHPHHVGPWNLTHLQDLAEGTLTAEPSHCLPN